MSGTSDLRLARLLQLASPVLPVGAYSYSQGLEAAVDAGIVNDAGSAGVWIGGVLELSMARMEAPVFLRMVDAWRRDDTRAVDRWNVLLLASRESAEFRAETVQMGYSLSRLLSDIGDFDARELAALRSLGETAFAAAFAFAAAKWAISRDDALVAYVWAWLENQVMAAVKAVPLGQTDGQRLLHAFGARLGGIAAGAAALDDDDLGSYAPGLAILSSRHETQYSRLFRS
ncbi:MAG: urease accessory protein UreF [Betaproteobacteria bacterium]|jgi:urease accessory protein|nr:urease accessory protein UreF [Betaproteobacteria bacterium]